MDDQFTCIVRHITAVEHCQCSLHGVCNAVVPFSFPFQRIVILSLYGIAILFVMNVDMYSLLR